MPVLHGVSLSPFVRKVRIALLEKAVDYELESVMPGSPDKSFRKISPLGKVPVYQDGDFSLPDSSAICAYLERAHPNPALYPSNAGDFGRALWFEEYADTKLVDVINPVFFQRVVQKIVYKQPPDADLVADALENAIPGAFDYLETEVRDDQWLVGESFGIADIAMGALFVGLRHGQESVDAVRWPKLAAYVARAEARPSIATLIAEEEASLAAF